MFPSQCSRYRCCRPAAHKGLFAGAPNCLTAGHTACRHRAMRSSTQKQPAGTGHAHASAPKVSQRSARADAAVHWLMIPASCALFKATLIRALLVTG
jgi:hypothetical protein